jgi:soluble P-type ATPase
VTREFTGENIPGRETLCFSGKVASVVARGGSLFRRVRGAIWESRQQKVHFKMTKRTDDFGTLSEEQKFAQDCIARARFHINR